VNIAGFLIFVNIRNRWVSLGAFYVEASRNFILPSKQAGTLLTVTKSHRLLSRPDCNCSNYFQVF